MKELNGYIKEREQLIRKIAKLEVAIRKEVRPLEVHYLEQDLTISTDNLKTVNEIIEKIKFEGEKY